MSVALILAEIISTPGATEVVMVFPDWLKGVLGTLVAVTTGWLTYRGVRVKANAEKKVAEINAHEKGQEVLLSGLIERVTALERRVESLESENLKLEGENARLNTVARTQADLIEGLMRFLDHLEEWIEAGSPPPPPSYPWVVRMHREGPDRDAP